MPTYTGIEHGDRLELQDIARRQGGAVLSRAPCEEGEAVVSDSYYICSDLRPTVCFHTIGNLETMHD